MPSINDELLKKLEEMQDLDNPTDKQILAVDALVRALDRDAFIRAVVENKEELGVSSSLPDPAEELGDTFLKANEETADNSIFRLRHLAIYARAIYTLTQLSTEELSKFALLDFSEMRKELLKREPFNEGFLKLIYKENLFDDDFLKKLKVQAEQQAIARINKVVSQANQKDVEGQNLIDTILTVNLSSSTQDILTKSKAIRDGYLKLQEALEELKVLQEKNSNFIDTLVGGDRKPYVDHLKKLIERAQTRLTTAYTAIQDYKGSFESLLKDKLPKLPDFTNPDPAARSAALGLQEQAANEYIAAAEAIKALLEATETPDVTPISGFLNQGKLIAEEIKAQRLLAEIQNLNKDATSRMQSLPNSTPQDFTELKLIQENLKKAQDLYKKLKEVQNNPLFKEKKRRE